jgi:acetylornithine deacetylase/succinyl-diaminopimelate desuccinylase-like protein
VNLKFFFEGEEEAGSPHLETLLREHAALLAADLWLFCDGPVHQSGRQQVVFGVRGVLGLEMTFFGPVRAVHSGHYGNWVPNPALRLAQILASMKDERGRVTIPGFYDGVSLDSAALAELTAVPDDEAALMAQLGIAETDTVAGALQKALQYPSLNIRGLSSAWVGAQARTIIPATATAEVDVRLVVESDAERLLRLIRQHIEGLGYLVIDRVPTDEERRRHPRIVTFTSEVSYGAYRTAFDSEPGRWLSAAVEHLYGEEPIKIRTSGGSVPISPFVTTLGVPAVAVATVNPDNNQHSPNENIRVGSFLEGIAIVLAILTQPIPDRPPGASGG